MSDKVAAYEEFVPIVHTCTAQYHHGLLDHDYLRIVIHDGNQKDRKGINNFKPPNHPSKSFVKTSITVSKHTPNCF